MKSRPLDSQVEALGKFLCCALFHLMGHTSLRFVVIPIGGNRFLFPSMFHAFLLRLRFFCCYMQLTFVQNMCLCVCVLVCGRIVSLISLISVEFSAQEPF